MYLISIFVTLNKIHQNTYNIQFSLQNNYVEDLKFSYFIDKSIVSQDTA